MTYVNTETDDVVMITELAAEKVHDLMAERELEGHALRVFVAGASCSGVQYGLAFEETPREEDKTLQLDGLTVVVDANSLPFVTGVHIDYVETPRGAGFRITNPSASPQSLCGGGCSSC